MDVQNINALKKPYVKFISIFLAVIFFVLILLIVSSWLLQKYNLWQGQKRVQNLAESLKKLEQEDYQKAMADTYGGKTPQETLRMYIDAVEKGDYELASKYFIGDNQERELKSFNGTTKENIKKYLSILNEVLRTPGNYYSGNYMRGGKEFIVDSPLYVRMRIYPNGIWKIIEI